MYLDTALRQLRVAALAGLGQVMVVDGPMLDPADVDAGVRLAAGDLDGLPGDEAVFIEPVKRAVNIGLRNPASGYEVRRIATLGSRPTCVALAPLLGDAARGDRLDVVVGLEDGTIQIFRNLLSSTP